MLTSRPKYKYILGGELTMNKFSVTLNNSLVGPAYFSNVAYADFGQLKNLQTTFHSRLLTDVSLSYQISKDASISVMVNNIFNLYPKWKIQALNADGAAFLKDDEQRKLLIGDLTFNGRYQYQTYDGSHINQLGTTFLGQLTYKF